MLHTLTAPPPGMLQEIEAHPFLRTTHGPSPAPAAPPPPERDMTMSELVVLVSLRSRSPACCAKPLSIILPPAASSSSWCSCYSSAGTAFPVSTSPALGVPHKLEMHQMLTYAPRAPHFTGSAYGIHALRPAHGSRKCRQRYGSCCAPHSTSHHVMSRIVAYSLLCRHCG
jgi:hypothetical protein